MFKYSPKPTPPSEVGSNPIEVQILSEATPPSKVGSSPTTPRQAHQVHDGIPTTPSTGLLLTNFHPLPLHLPHFHFPVDFSSPTPTPCLSTCTLGLLLPLHLSLGLKSHFSWWW